MLRRKKILPPAPLNEASKGGNFMLQRNVNAILRHFSAAWSLAPALDGKKIGCQRGYTASLTGR
jgi:hypothetical protein